jgi:predicted negative regulator of RcsB-dependent stress response
VDEFLTDEEQAERAKKWLRENTVFVVAGVTIGLGSLFGYQQWQDYSQNQASEASAIWEQLRSAVDGKRFNEVTETLELLEKDFTSTPYLDQARLALARMYVERNEIDVALEQLALLARSGGDVQLRRVAEFRMAQLLNYLERYEEALGVLGQPDTNAFAAQYHELKGDVLFAQGEMEGARVEYKAALNVGDGASMDRTLVQMKLDDVAGLLAGGVTMPLDAPNDAPVDNVVPVEDPATDTGPEPDTQPAS